MDLEKPFHRHKCKWCTWVGTLGHPGKLSTADPVDVYFCDKDRKSLLVIRYGKGDNVGIHDTEKQNWLPEFNEGLRMAREQGML